MQKKEYTGTVGDLSPEQEVALNKFREEVKAMGVTDPRFDDTYLLRFLRARKFDLVKTKEMWVNFINWRKENNVDEIANYVFSEIDEVKQAWPHGYFRTDKKGRPIYIERTGLLKLQQLFKCTTEERMIKYWIQSYERLTNQILPACAKARGEKVEQTLTIIDLKGSSTKLMSKQVYDFVKLASNIGQNYYPEIMGKMFIINAPLLFSGVWAMMKPWIDEKTRAKIEIIGSKYEAKIHEHIDIFSLPDFLGGKLTEADYGVNMSREQGPWVTVPVFDSNANFDDDEEEERKQDKPEYADLKNALAGMNFSGSLGSQRTNDDEIGSNTSMIPSDTPLNTQADDG